jgi:hypothetical protein
MKSVLVGAASFLLTAVLVGVLFSAQTLLSGPVDRFGNFLMGAYLSVVGGVLGMPVYAAATACSRRWRRQPPWRSVALSAIAALVACGLQLTGIQVLPLVLLRPLFRAQPVAGAVLLHAIPGLLAGLVAIGVAALLGSNNAA